MNEMNSLEARLKSWVPRKASRKLERKALAARRKECHANHYFAWLVPAAACVLFAVSGSHRDGAEALSAERAELVAMSLSNQSYSSLLPGGSRNTWNRWDTFGWTNGGGFNSSRHPFSPDRTDDSEGR